MAKFTKFLVVDSRNNFINDLNTKMLIDDYDFEVEITSTTTRIDEIVESRGIEAVVLASNVVNDYESNLELPIYWYKVRPTDEFNSDFPCLGFVKKTDDLLDLFEADLDCINENSENSSIKIDSEKDRKSSQVSDSTNKIKSLRTESITVDKSTSTDEEEDGPSWANESRDFELPSGSKTNRSMDEKKNIEIESSQSVKSDTKSTESLSMQELIKRNVNSEIKQKEQIAYSDVMRDIEKTRRKTKVISVYSAKGGVGKTTISTSLAMYLAATYYNRKRARVCIVDYNIDFGDVTSAINFDNSGINMSMWASVIREQIEKGYDINNITYTQSDIEGYLQKRVFEDKHDDIEVYGLVAPVIHGDSFAIKEAELKHMLESIIKYGNFDFVICDTGKNTRDSTTLALTLADYIFMIATQDLSTINDNDSFISTTEALNMEFKKKIKVIVNNIFPADDVGVSPSDVEWFVKNKYGFECVAQIKHNTDVIKANNRISEDPPLVFTSEHEFTKELRKVVKLLIDEESQIKTPTKKSFFERFFTKRSRDKRE